MNKIPSWQVTDEQLESFGFPVEVVGKVCGSRTVMKQGDVRGIAIHKAWAAGFVKIESEPVDRNNTWAENHPTQKCEPDLEVLAFLKGES